MQEMGNKLQTQQKNFLGQVLNQKISEDYLLNNKSEINNNHNKLLNNLINLRYNLRLLDPTLKQRSGLKEINGLEMTKQ